MKARIYATGIAIFLAAFSACGADESMRKPTVNLDKDKAESKKAPDNAIKMNVEKILLSSDFEQDPLGAGWRYDAPKIKGVAPTGQWTDVAAASGKRCLSAANGGWTSPAIPVKEFEYYALRFMSKADGKSYWAANFFAADGKQINGDHYSSFDPSQNWKENMFCFRARPNTATVRISFEPIANKMIFVDDITVQAISRAEVAKWADAVYATIAPVSFVPPADRWQNLPKTMEALRSGKTLKVVMLGDSIINDTANSAFDVRVERLYPGARLNIVNSVRGAQAAGTGRKRTALRSMY